MKLKSNKFYQAIELFKPYDKTDKMKNKIIGLKN